MSKKIAEGIGGLVLDVKTGAGAFMKTIDDSRRLAESLVAIGNASGVRTEALITVMNAPLGRAVGNANEIVECIETLKGEGPERSRSPVRGPGGEDAGACADLASTEATRRERCGGLSTSGAALEVFRRIIENQGGDPARHRRLHPFAVRAGRTRGSRLEPGS